MCKEFCKARMCEKKEIERKQKLEKSVKRKENEKHAKKRIGKQKEKRTKKLGTNGLEKKEKYMNYSI